MRILPEKGVKQHYFVFLGSHHLAGQSENLYFRQQGRQFLIIQLFQLPPEPSGPLERSIVMNDQLLVFSLMNVKLEHVKNLLCFFKQFKSIFGPFETSTAMTNGNELFPLEKFVEDRVAIPVPAAGEAKEDGGDDDVGAGDNEPEPVQVHRAL